MILLWYHLNRIVKRSLSKMRQIIYSLILSFEKTFKGLFFSCSMCGQCILTFTAFTCPMQCPKGLRNGPCGGYTSSGGCEIGGGKRCVWVTIYKRSRSVNRLALLKKLQPPLNWTLAGTSSWLNHLNGIDGQKGARKRC